MEALLALWTLSFLAMLGVLGYQAYLYLKTGAWVEMSVTDSCYRWLHIDWCAWPSDWIGVHHMLTTINVGFFIWSVSSVIVWIGVAGEESRKGKK